MNDRAREEALARVVDEARVALVPRDVDWASVEAGLVERARRAHEVSATRPSRARAWVALGAAAFAAAAAVSFVVSTRAVRDDAEQAAPVAAREPAAAPASALVSTTGEGVVLIGGEPARAGRVLRAGDEIEAPLARAVFQRDAKVTWLLEGQDGRGEGAGRARVTHAGDALVLALEEGAIEAQVTPVPSGEAFAVDVATDHGTVRVAVHGTHLRVSRSGARVVVDLTEGVVAIGPPPRSGLTSGTTITAPAHVELDARNVQGTLTIDRAPASVRAAVPLGAAATQGGHAEEPSSSDRTEPLPVAEAPRPVAPRAPAAPRVPPREAIARAVRDCAAAQGKGADVKVTVKSTLRLRVDERGKVTSAQFDPPLRPDIQSCAAEAIYKVTLDETGSVTVPIEFAY